MRLCGARGRVGENVPSKLAVRSEGVRPYFADRALQECLRVGANLLRPAGRVLEVGAIRRLWRIGKHSAKVDGGLWTLRPRFLGHHVGHVTPSVERFGESSGDVGWALPTQALEVLRQPDLEGLGGHGLHLFYHPPPAIVPREDLPTDVSDYADADAQQHKVEVFADLKHSLVGATSIPVGFEVASFSGESVAVDELREVGRGGPASAAAHLRQRLIRLSAARLGLHVEVEGADVILAAEADIGQAVEELEANPTADQRLVERSEHDVPHPGSHAPHERAPVAEECAQRAPQTLPRRQAWAAWIATRVAHREVVESPQERRLT